jgi:hypothetical protein
MIMLMRLMLPPRGGTSATKLACADACERVCRPMKIALGG